MPKYEWSRQGIGEWMRDTSPSDGYIQAQAADIKATMRQLIDLDSRAAEDLVELHSSVIWAVLQGLTSLVDIIELKAVHADVSQAWVQAVYGRKD